MSLRVGIGYDVHPLVKGRPCVLGGVEIPHEKGLDGYSDADVLLHAISDALLGAAGEGDLGRHFKVGDPRWHGVSSMTILKEVVLILKKKGYCVVNCDSVVIAESPKIAPFAGEMIKNISRHLSIEPEADRKSVV